MYVDVSCKKCGTRKRMDIGAPGSGTMEEYLHLLVERLSHRPDFECFGSHFELAPPLPNFWEIHWDTLGEG